jgi:Zn-dependent M28 family amino/carboxypeptidase
MSKRSFGLLAVALAAVLALVAPSAEARPQRPPQVDVDGIVDHLEALQEVADDNDGTRASGTPGYEASVDYVVRRLQQAGYSPRVQEFTFPFFQQLSPSTFEEISPTPRTFVEGTDYFLGEFSGAGDVEAPLQGVVDNVFPPTPEPSSSAGCEDEDFAGFTAGNIALIQRGTCTFEEKVINAVEAQAAGVVLFNEGQPGRTDAFTPALAQPFDIPVVMASFAVGDSLNAEMAAGEVVVHLVTDTMSENRQTWNVLADTRTGSPNHTVVVGAHLDSVLAGPGINDNGSGSAAILEVAEELAERRGGGNGAGLRNRIRFAFWGAEEAGLLGSEHYVSTLTERQLSRIQLNLNFDMVGSPNFVRFVYDGDGSDTDTAGPAGSDAIEAQFLRHFERRGLATEPTAFDGRSDYGPFIAVGIPAGGLFTGAEGLKTPEEAVTYGGTAGEPYDPCYHAECDTIDNVNTTVLAQMGRAIARATWYWGQHRLPPRAPSEATTTSRVSGTHHGHAVIA